jgi:hypothetical protein
MRIAARQAFGFVSRDHALERSLRHALLAGLVGCTLTVGSVARADTDQPRQRRFEDTAYTLSAGELSIGFFDLQVGTLSELTIGTYIAPWFLFPVLDTPIPTGFVKLRDWIHGPIALSFRATLIYVSATALRAGLGKGDEVNADAIILPLEAATSVDLGPRFTQSFALTYVLTEGSGSQSSSTSIAGAVSARQLTLSALSEYRITRTFSLTLHARVLVARSNLRARIQGSQGATKIDADVGLSTDYGHLVACIVPGIALHGSAVNFELGLGYGSWWLPIVNLPLPFIGPVPEANFYVRF